MILGVVLAGGKASRFGSDKALALLDGQTLLALAINRLAAWCDAVVVVGRTEAPVPCLPDWPRPDMGPLAGLAAALHHARDGGFAAVLSCGVDSLGLPDDLPDLLKPTPAFLLGQPVVGLWPVSASSEVDALLQSDARHSMLAFAHAIGARAISLEAGPANINTPEDLARLQAAEPVRPEA